MEKLNALRPIDGIARIKSALSAITRVGAFADRRYRRAGMASMGSAASSGLQFVVQLVITPMLLAYLGNAKFGVWMTLYSFVALLGFLDFGVGLGLLNALAYCHGRDDVTGARRYVSSALAVLTVIAVLVGLVCLFGYPHISWGAVFNLSNSSLAHEAGVGGAILMLCIVVAVPTTIGARVLGAYQLAYVSSMWDIGSKALILVGVPLVVSLHGGLPAIVGVVVGAPVLTGIGCTIVLFMFLMPALRPSFSSVSRSAAFEILRQGSMFLILQLVVAGVFASDNIIIARIQGVGAVASYSVMRTLYNFLSMPITIMTMPLWPAYSEALARGDFAWIKKTFRRSFLFVLGVASLGGALLLVLGPMLLHLWVGNRVHASFALFAGFSAFTIVSISGASCATLLNAASALRFQVICAVIMAACAITAKIMLGSRFGVEGVIWGTAIAYALTSYLPTLLYLHRWFSRLPS